MTIYKTSNMQHAIIIITIPRERVRDDQRRHNIKHVLSYLAKATASQACNIISQPPSNLLAAWSSPVQCEGSSTHALRRNARDQPRNAAWSQRITAYLRSGSNE